MTAIPVKSNTKESAMAPLFGKAKWFAMVADNGEVTFWHNEAKSGRAVVDQFSAMGVKRVIFQDMGGNPFMMLQRAAIACYHAGVGRILFTDALDQYKKGGLTTVTSENMGEFIEKGHKHAKAGAHQHGHDHQHRHHGRHGGH